MTDKPPDYTTMNAREFQRAVGFDPEKWAEAFCQRSAHMTHHELTNDRDFFAMWFRDAMAAAVRAHGGRPVP